MSDPTKTILSGRKVDQAETNNIHIAVQAVVRTAVGAAKAVSVEQLEAHLERISKAQTLGAVVDPTLYAASEKALRVENDVVRALMDFREDLDRIAADAKDQGLVS